MTTAVLTDFCSFICNFISPSSFTSGSIDNFDQMGVCRHIDIANLHIYFKMLIYTKSRVVGPSSLFTVGTVTRVILMLPTFLDLLAFLAFA